MYKKILLAYDGSETGQKALIESRAMADWGGAEIVLIAVMPPPAAFIGGEGGVYDVGLEEEERKEFQSILEDGVKRLSDSGLKVTGEVLVGEPVLEIADCADPCFAAFILLKDAGGRKVLRNYCRTYAQLAVRFGAGFVYESPTWRANPDWATKLGYSPAELEAANRDAIRLMHEVLARMRNARFADGDQWVRRAAWRWLPGRRGHESRRGGPLS